MKNIGGVESGLRCDDMYSVPRRTPSSSALTQTRGFVATRPGPHPGEHSYYPYFPQAPRKPVFVPPLRHSGKFGEFVWKEAPFRGRIRTTCVGGKGNVRGVPPGARGEFGGGRMEGAATGMG